jgi:hypothetical protein
MNFNRHYELEGKHAFLSASKYHWLNYDEDRLVTVYENNQAKIRGTLLHQFACDAITYGVPLSEDGSTLSMYVNDCIMDSMIPEVVLYYSKNAFGTADAISFDEDAKILRIYDFKSGKTPASMKQLEIYAALFCLEYQINPNDIAIHLRIYQNNEVLFCDSEASDIWNVMDRIIAFDDILRSIKTDTYR